MTFIVNPLNENSIERDKKQSTKNLFSDKVDFAFDLAKVAWWEMELPSGKVTFNRNKTDFLGFEHKDFKHFNDFTGLIHPEDLDRVMQSMHNLISGKTEHYKVEYRIRDANTNYKWFFDIGSVIEKDPELNNIKVAGFALDISEKKDILSEIDNHKIRINALMEALPDWVFVSTKEGVYTQFWAKELTDLLVQPSEFIGKHYSEILPKYLCDDVQLAIDKVFETGEMQTIEYSLNINGKIEHYESRLVRCGEEELLSVVRNITERKKIYEQLLKSKLDYEKLYNLASLMSNTITDMLWAKDLNKKYIFANSAICHNLLGEPNENEVLGKDDLFFAIRERESQPNNPFWHTFGELCKDSDEITIKENKPMTFLEHGYVQGKYIYLDVRKAPLYDKNGNLIGVVGSGRDITEQIKTNDTLKTLYRAFEQSQISILITDKNANIEYVNPAFCKISGYLSEEIIGKNPKILKSGHTPDEDYRQIWEKLNKGEDWSGIFLNKKKNGDLFWESATISPVKDDNGKTTHFVAVKEDITEKKKMESNLVAALKQAEDSNRLKSFFLANINHELRTPLNGILGFAKILTEQLKNEEHLSMSFDILESAKRLSTTLNLIIDIANIEAENTNIQFELLEITGILRECFDNYKGSALQKKLNYHLEIKQKPIYSYLDKNYFIQIISNLIDNAIKFTEKGEIEIECGLEKRNNMLYVKVKDTGIGIPKDKIELIWLAFRQVSEGLSRAYEGTGLGLTIVKKAVELMRGKVIVASELNEGSEFSVYFPVSDTNKSESMQPAGKQIKTGERLLQILYVEDDEINQSVVRMFLKNKYIVETSADALTALEMTKNKKYDIILMDINLGPGMNGAELTRIIKQNPIYKDTPIVAVTAYTQESEKRSFFEKGCTHYLPKPFLKNDLVFLLENLNN